MSKSRLLTPLLFASITFVATLLPISSAFAACNDCHWLYVRCMSRANTSELAQQCEESRALCEETFCQNPLAASLTDSLRPAAGKPSPAPAASAPARQTGPQRSAQ